MIEMDIEMDCARVSKKNCATMQIYCKPGRGVRAIGVVGGGSRSPSLVVRKNKVHKEILKLVTRTPRGGGASAIQNYALFRNFNVF